MIYKAILLFIEHWDFHYVYSSVCILTIQMQNIALDLTDYNKNFVFL